MYGARIVEKAATASLLANPLHPYTQALFKATSDPDAANLKTFKEVPTGASQPYEPAQRLPVPSALREDHQG